MRWAALGVVALLALALAGCVRNVDGVAAWIGGSAAQSVVLMVIVIALTAFQFRYVERKVQY